jgi:hypothetical protein
VVSLRLLVASFLLAAPGVHAQPGSNGAAGSPPDTVVESKVYPVGDAVGVYRAVLDLLYIDGKERPPFIVLFDTAVRAAGGPCPVRCKQSWPHRSTIDTATIIAYARPRGNRPRIIGFGYRIPIKLVNGSEFERLRNDGYGFLADRPANEIGPVEAFWAGYRHKYGRSWGYAMLGKVAFNPTHSEALIGVMQVCGENCRSVEAIFLQRNGRRWRAVERIPDYVETFHTSGNFRYRGPAGENANQSQLIATGRAARSESDDAADVYRAVLDSLYRFHGESPRTIAITEMHASVGTDVPVHRSQIDSSTIASYRFFAGVNDAMYPRFKYRIPIVWVSAETLKSLERSGGPLAQAAAKRMEDEQSPLWLAFHSRYPAAWGYASLGRVGFNPLHTQALVVTQHFCGTACLNGDTWFLRRDGRRWRIVERIARDNRPGIGIDGLRYLGPDADPKWYQRRSVHGTVTNALTGERLPGTEIAVYHSAGYARSVRSDPEGRYAVSDLPLSGGILFKVRCPIATRADSLWGGDFATSPGLDTTFDISLDYRHCLHLNRAHPILAGALRFDSMSLARQTSPAEEAVYQAVLDTLYPAGAGRGRTLLETTTFAACTRCIEPETPRLVRQQQMDAFSESSFASVQQDSTQLRPFSMDGRRLDVMPLEDMELFVGSNEWDALKDAYPGVSSVVGFSRVGFNESGTEALVSVRIDSARSTGAAETMLLRKTGPGWRVVLRDIGREATSGEWVGGRCEPTEMPSHAPEPSEIQRLTGAFTIVRVGASREFRGVTDSVRIRIDTMKASTRNRAAMVARVDWLDKNGRPNPKIAGTLELAARSSAITFTDRLPEGVMQFDGWMDQYTILRTNGRDFFGRWETSNGPVAPSVGYFCALSAAPR